jgi:alkylhydroperoxidase family enzyme
MIPLDHQPELFAAFNQYYGILWSRGVVDQASKETGRLRNARVTGCNLCKALRFDGAVEDGLTEDLVDQIADGHEHSDLPPRLKLVLRWADALIIDPSSISDDLRAEMLAEFTPPQIVELTATITTAMGFSKAALALGPPPDMDVMLVPTPAPGGSVVNPFA